MPTRWHASTRSIIAVVAACALTAGMTTAQPRVAPSALATASFSPFVGTTPCFDRGDANGVGARASASVVCNYPADGASGTAGSDARLGDALSVRTRVTTDRTFAGLALAQAESSDELVFTGTRPDFIEIVVNDFGSAASRARLTSLINGVTYPLTGVAPSIIPPGPRGTTVCSDRSPTPTIREYEGAEAMNFTWLAVCDLRGNTDMRFMLTHALQLRLAPEASAELSAVFTSLIAGLRFLDVSGNDISNQVRFESTGGVSYRLGVTVVPEPRALVLLTIGITLLSLHRSVRRRAAEWIRTAPR